MEIRVLQYFLTVAQEESVTKAAEVLHITQPTLSRQLAQLEREQWVALLPPGDPLTAKDTVTAEDLEKLPLILPERLTMQSELASWFGPRFSRLTVACTGNLKTNSAVAVREGCGCALTVGGLSAFWDENKLAVRPLSPALYTTAALAWKREQPLGRAAERFIQFASCFLSMDKA